MGYSLRRPVTPGFFKVFRYENADESPGISLADVLKDGKVVVSENLLLDYKGDRTLMNRELINPDDTTQTYRIGAVTKKVRYNDFWPNYSDKYIAIELKESDIAGWGNASWLEMSIRVKPNTSSGFAERLMELSDSQFSVGNLFILRVESYKDIRRFMLLEPVNQTKMVFWMLTFLLVNIFLGIIGTFWFRTQHRRVELGLRIATGATRRSLWGILNGEGILLLVLAAIPACFLAYTVGETDMVQKWNIAWTFGRFSLCCVLTFILIAIMIFAGIWYPARQAMKIQPADALHEE